MKFKRHPAVSGYCSGYYDSGEYLIRKMEPNSFGDTWTAFFQGQRIATATHLRCAIAVCKSHQSRQRDEAWKVWYAYARDL